MNESKRLNLLKSFLKFYKVEKIELINESADSISGIAIYDESDPEEKQEFIWHKTENEVAAIELNILIEKIIEEKWHDGYKIIKNISEIDFIEFDNETRNKMEFELFEIKIRMVDDGEETDSFFVHF